MILIIVNALRLCDRRNFATYIYTYTLFLIGKFNTCTFFGTRRATDIVCSHVKSPTNAGSNSLSPTIPATYTAVVETTEFEHAVFGGRYIFILLLFGVTFDNDTCVLLFAGFTPSKTPTAEAVMWPYCKINEDCRGWCGKAPAYCVNQVCQCFPPRKFAAVVDLKKDSASGEQSIP